MARAAGTGKPFLKWAGGKAQLLGSLRQVYPAGLGEHITRYAEPFVGGGAVLFDLLGSYALEEVYISDVNAALINAYRVVRGDVEGLIALLSPLQAAFLPLDHQGRRAFYYEQRARYNEWKSRPDAAGAEGAALLLFLNRTCFNGLYRVNRRGLFNVPMGAYQNPLICDGENLRALSARLKNVTIVCGDYRRAADFIDGRTFAYFDPPYRPLTPTASFTAYTEHVFDDEAQAELAAFVTAMARRGARVAVSNSDPRNARADDDFFDALYAGYHIRRVRASRMINSNSSARGPISELLISNYDMA